MLSRPSLLARSLRNASKHRYASKMSRPPFKEVEATRPAFDAAEQWSVSKIPQPDWVPGTGANGRQDLPGVKEGLWDGQEKEGKFRRIDPGTSNVGGIYKMMISAITPRPIGFISSINAKGETNLAPFSYFNMVCHNPPMVMVSFTHPNGDELKGSCENILETKEFSANIISEPFIEAANYTSIDAPKGVSEWPLSGLTPVESETIKSPRVGESAFSMECVLDHHYHIHNDAGVRTGTMVLGRVKLFHVRSDLVDENLIVDTNKLQPVSRLGGITYGRITSVYETPRPVWEKDKETDVVKKALEKEGKP